MTKPRIVVVNDTDVNGYHFGCARVMSIIRNQLSIRGLDIVGSVAVSLNWQDANAKLVNSADILVINGEGTLHHGSRKGRWLLEAAQSVKGRGRSVALINALWQNNPADWGDLIRDVDILCCRDSRSVSAMVEATGRDVRFIGDLSMSQPVPQVPSTRSGVVIGDSVHANVTAALAKLATKSNEFELVPVTSSLKFLSPNLTGLRRKLRTAYATMKQKRFLAQNPSARFLANEDEYLSMVSKKSLSITGRFHAVCLAIATQTPFVAVTSNSWKIEALIEDIGLNTERMTTLTDLANTDLSEGRWDYSADELANIEACLTDWHSAANTLFDDIAALA